MNTISVAMSYQAAREDVWNALVSPERLRRWLGEAQLPADDAEPIRIAVTGTGEDVAAHVTHCVAGCRLVLEWTVDDVTSTVTLVLGDAESGTVVIVQEEDVPESMLDAFRRGWRAHLRRLEAELSAAPMPSWAALAQA